MLKGWRTVLVNVGFALAAGFVELLSYLAVFDWRTVLPPEYVPYVTLGIAVANIMMRAASSTRIGEAPSGIRNVDEGEVTP